MEAIMGSDIFQMSLLMGITPSLFSVGIEKGLLSQIATTKQYNTKDVKTKPPKSDFFGGLAAYFAKIAALTYAGAGQTLFA
jgi:hypothetical protein